MWTVDLHLKRRVSAVFFDKRKTARSNKSGVLKSNLILFWHKLENKNGIATKDHLQPLKPATWTFLPVSLYVPWGIPIMFLTALQSQKTDPRSYVNAKFPF